MLPMGALQQLQRFCYGDLDLLGNVIGLQTERQWFDGWVNSVAGFMFAAQSLDQTFR